MCNKFEPRNNLEESLLEAQEGRISGENFMRVLTESQVYMPVHEDQEKSIGNIQLDNKARPLSIQDDNGVEFLVLFTSPERAVEFVKNFPGYEGGGLLTEFTWILEKAGIGFGISLNPGWPVGIDLEPEAVQQLTEADSRSA